ncbi:sugar phosphate isomerase/epimerase [Cypionkella sp.]|uniref:sugar phosphate isomerase/epimerase family protein n=1 Tax=Cypionkella sp. TaxID=2811411 RepID=UPI00271B2535|nr:sugar phosphate isomerase/epimerase [Cypionkella sp.]MDO8986359.1 sugar phosphate isomerase/epimerase [Cypionkella sp.]MDP2050036.1 sugar phosphate isomerase/epimerase [Cypionkella sp.]
MKGFGVHTSMWTMNWDRAGAESAVAGALSHGFDFVEIALTQPTQVDAPHTAALLEKHGLSAVCSLGLPERCWASRHPDLAIDYLKTALDVTMACGALALSGVTFGGIGERTGHPPTETEIDNVARTLEAAAKHARKLGLEFGIEPVNRYENHILNTGWQAVAMIERVGADNIFVHLDTYHMNIEEKGAGNGILDAKDHLRYIHLSESDRGTPGEGNCPWDEIFATLRAIGFSGGLAMESFINMPPELGFGLSVWRPVAKSRDEVLSKGLPFLRNKAQQYKLI